MVVFDPSVHPLMMYSRAKIYGAIFYTGCLGNIRFHFKSDSKLINFETAPAPSAKARSQSLSLVTET